MEEMELEGLLILEIQEWLTAIMVEKFYRVIGQLIFQVSH